MTELTITPDYGKKRLKFAGTVAAGEHVAVTVAGAGDWASAEGAVLRLRVLFGNALVGIVGGDAEAENPWQTHSDDPTIAEGAARCELNLNTIPAEKMLKCGGNCFWILDDATNHTLYGAGEWDVRAWPKHRGVDEPIDLDGYPQLVEDMEELKEAWEDYKTTVNAALEGKADKATTYTKGETDAAIAAAKNGRFKIVQELPSVTEAESNVIYLVPRTDGETGNVYDEWVVVDGAWDKIGTADVDLTDYYNKSEVDSLLTGKVPTTRKVNNKALSADVTLTASDVGALPTSGGQVTGNINLPDGAGRNYALRIGTRDNNSDNGIWWLGLAADCGICCESLSGNMRIVSEGNIISLPSAPGTLALTSDIPSVSGLAPLASPAFTGTPTAPTPTSGDNSKKVATTAFVKKAVDSISVTPLSGNTYDFSTMQGVFDALKAAIEALGGTVTNAPTTSTSQGE